MFFSTVKLFAVNNTEMRATWVVSRVFIDERVGSESNKANAREIMINNKKANMNAGRLFLCGPGSYQFEDNNVWDNHVAVVERIREINWIDGFQFYRYENWKNQNYWTTAKNEFFPNVTKIRASAFLDTTRPEPPEIVLTKLDSAIYRISVYPSDSGETPERFIIYRVNNDSIIDINSANILRIKFGDRSFHQTDYISERSAGYFYYGVTAADRLWNESALSNIVKPDSIAEKSIVPKRVTLD